MIYWERRQGFVEWENQIYPEIELLNVCLHRHETSQQSAAGRASGARVRWAYSFFSWVIRRVDVRDTPGSGSIELHYYFLLAPGKMVRLRLHDHHASRR